MRYLARKTENKLSYQSIIEYLTLTNLRPMRCTVFSEKSSLFALCTLGLNCNTVNSSCNSCKPPSLRVFAGIFVLGYCAISFMVQTFANDRHPMIFPASSRTASFVIRMSSVLPCSFRAFAVI